MIFIIKSSRKENSTSIKKRMMFQVCFGKYITVTKNIISSKINAASNCVFERIKNCHFLFASIKDTRKIRG